MSEVSEFNIVWEVYTMRARRHYDDDYEPIDDDDLREWSVGFGVKRGGNPHGAMSAFPIAQGMTYGMARYVADLHNVQFQAKASAS